MLANNFFPRNTFEVLSFWEKIHPESERNYRTNSIFLIKICISIYTVYPIVPHLDVHHHKSWHLKGKDSVRASTQKVLTLLTSPPSLWELCDDSLLSGKHKNVAETGEATSSFHTQYGKGRGSGESQSSFERHLLEKTELE